VQTSTKPSIARIEHNPRVAAAVAKEQRIAAKIAEVQAELAAVEARILSGEPAPAGEAVDLLLAGATAIRDDAARRRELEGALRALKNGALAARQAVSNAEGLASVEIESVVAGERIRLAQDVVAAYDKLCAAQAIESAFIDSVEAKGYSLGRIPGRTLCQAHLPPPFAGEPMDEARRDAVETIEAFRKVSKPRGMLS